MSETFGGASQALSQTNSVGHFSAQKARKNQQNYTFGGQTNIRAAPFDRETLPAQYAYSQTGNSEYFQSFNRAVQKANDL